MVRPRACGQNRMVSLIPSNIRCGSIESNEVNARPSFGAEARIVGGLATVASSHPWLVRVAGRSCGGAIIGKNTVITAGHCCGDRIVKISIGERLSGTVQVFQATKIIRHPRYDDSTLVNDICILEFEEELPLDSRVNPACLPNPEDRPLPGQECFIAGWGYQQYDKPSSAAVNLMESAVPIIDYRTCAEWFKIENMSRDKYE